MTPKISINKQKPTDELLERIIYSRVRNLYGLRWIKRQPILEFSVAPCLSPINPNRSPMKMKLDDF